MRVLLLCHRVGDEGEHWPHLGLGSPQPLADLQMRTVKRARAARPEILGGVVAGEGIEVADLRAVAAGDAHYMMLREVKGLARLRRDVATLVLTSK